MDLIFLFRRILPGTLILFAQVILIAGCSSSPKGSLSVASSPEDEHSALGLNFPLEKRVLSNGLTVLMVEDHTVPLISYQTWVNAGSVDEEFGFTGIAHLFEHLMFKGSEKFGPRAFFNELESKGALVNAYTARDYTVFHETFVPPLLDTVIRLEADRFSRLNLTEEMLDLERQVVFEERRLRVENSPEGRMQEEIWGLIFRSHPYRWPVIGYAEDLARIELKNLTEFFSRYYQPKNLVLVLVGDFKAAEAIRKIEAAYGSIPGRKRPEREIRPEPEQKELRRKTLHDRVASQQVLVAYPITSAREDDTYALDVLSNIFFGGVGARAHQRLVEQKAIAISTNGYSFTPTYPGIFTMRAVMKGKRAASLGEKEMEALVREVQTRGVTEAEVQAAVRQLRVQTVDSVRTAHGLGTLIGTVQLIFGDPYGFRTDLEKYSKVTPDDVKRVAQKYLIPTRKNVLTLMPGARDTVAMEEGEE